MNRNPGRSNGTVTNISLTVSAETETDQKSKYDRISHVYIVVSKITIYPSPTREIIGKWVNHRLNGSLTQHFYKRMLTGNNINPFAFFLTLRTPATLRDRKIKD
jgi:hypothetical protein